LRADDIKLFIYGSLVTLALAVFAIFPPTFIQYANNKSYDILMQALPDHAASRVPAMVGIDDQSLAQYGQWPWPRYILARLIEKIGDQGALAIGLDMIFPEPDRTSLSVVREEMSREWGVSFSDVPTMDQKLENDRVFAHALSATPTVLGYQFKFDDTSSPDISSLHPLKYSIREQAGSRKCRLPIAKDAVHSLQLLMDASGQSGFVNALMDRDGVLRRVPLVMECDGKLYPSLSMASLIKAYGNEQIRIEAGEDGFQVEWMDKKIPLDCNGFFLVRYRGKDAPFPYISAADILSGRISPSALKGKIVFIGVNASGMGDWHLSPMDRNAHGIEVHANIIDSILSGNFIRRPPWAPGAEMVIMLATGLFSSAALAAGGALWSLLFTALAGFTTWVLFYWLLLSHGIFLSPVMPVSILIANFAALNTIKYGREELKVRQRSQELILSQDAAILGLSSLVETRDENTGRHILRTQRYVLALARRLARFSKYKKVLDDQVIDLIYKSAPLHDIGKVGIPDRILYKPGKLTAEEFQVMRNHPAIGGQTIQKAQKMLSGRVDIPYLKHAYEIVISHHEKWDGSGYPEGLAGEAIPLSGRLMALADVYDALISERVYKPAYSHESARQNIVEEKGRHFDPDLVDAFLQEEETFQRIARELADNKLD